MVTGKYLSERYGRQSHIAILGENSYQWLVVFMAAVMSGNVAVPLDKELDAAGIQDFLNFSKFPFPHNILPMAATENLIYAITQMHNSILVTLDSL